VSHGKRTLPSFGRIVGTGVAAAALPRLFVPRLVAAPAPASGMVRLSSNENPFGPAQSAITAMHDAMRLAWRYPDEAADGLVDTIAKQNGVSAEQVLIGDGSGEILKVAADAFTGPTGKMVIADPTFEAIGSHARVAGADVVKVPLDAAYAHDLPKMAAVPSAGLIYVCNPNNPTASITPKAAVRAFLESLPTDTMVLVDEAYFHYAESPDYESVIPLVAARPNLIVARTFSKIYGMAGVRCGYGIAQRSVIDRLRQHQSWDSVNVFALAGASASLRDAQHVIDGRRRNSETRRQVVASLNKLGYNVVPSQANFIMVEVKRNVKPVIAAMRDRGVHVGRLFPAMPEHLRVTIGTPEQMERFVDAFRAVMA
jgi:histidinol-phosphate aminotransferase